MSRASLVDFAGARGRIAITDLLQLGPRWQIQEKRDGAYCQLHLDGQGRIERALSRSGQPFPRSQVGHLLGALVGAPGAVVIGELEGHTEAGVRSAATRGWAAVHLFDCIRTAGGRYIGREPYHVRRAELWRGQSAAECFGPGLPYERDGGGRLHNKASGRFCLATPTDWRLTPITPQLSRSEAVDVWERAQVGQAEGLVAVALNSRVGARGSKRKCKPTSSIDVTVVSVGRGAARVAWAGHVFAISCVGRALAVGDVVEIEAIGWSEKSVQPRHTRIVRVREDLRRAAA
jgi:hypothetical protein